MKTALIKFNVYLRWYIEIYHLNVYIVTDDILRQLFLRLTPLTPSVTYWPTDLIRRGHNGNRVIWVVGGLSDGCRLKWEMGGASSGLEVTLQRFRNHAVVSDAGVRRVYGFDGLARNDCRTY